MEITLTGHFKSFIAEQLQGGRYRDASEVVRAALRELEQRELKRSLADFQAAFRKTDRSAPKGEPAQKELGEIDRIIKAQRAARRNKRAGR
jgi:putative addiction module CopG family antidote